MSLGLLRRKLTEPGLVVSGVAHVALLVAALAAFSSTQKFSDAQEATAVEMISQAEFNEIMKGEKTAKEVKPAPRKAEKVAELPAPKPPPIAPDARADTPAPPPPLRRAPEPVAEETPPKPAAAKPEPVKAVMPPARPRSEPVKVAQAVPPAPLARPEPVKAAPPQKNADAKLEPDPPEDPENPMVVRPVPRVAKPEPPKPAAAAAAPPAPEPLKKIRPVEKPGSAAPEPPKLDAIAKQIAQPQPAPAKQALLKPDVATPAPAPAKPAAAQPAPAPQRVFDPSSIKDILAHEKPQRAPAAATEVSQTGSIGAPAQSAAKMPPSLMAALDGLMMDQYNQCWTDNGTGANGYVAQIRVQYAPDGSLQGQPTLTNPPADPALKGLAEDALRAIRKCNPLKIPAQYAPYYDQWRQRLLRMNPEDRTG